jgi:two-component system nitrate/nitrite sensor histidine kinase NarX
MDSILLAVVQLSLRLLKSDVAALVLWNDDRSGLETRYMAFPHKAVGVNVVEPSPLLRHLLQSCRARRYPDDLRMQHEPWLFNGKEILTGIVAPLCVNTQPIGGLWVGSFHNRPYHLADLMGLRSLSEQVTIALEYGMMKTQLQSMAVLEERARIAREMHDSVSQTLCSLGFQMLTLESMVRQGEQAPALDEIKRARENIKDSQADVRENILSLRTTLDGSNGAVEALQKYLAEYGLLTGIQTHWADASDDRRLSPMQEVQLVRVVQEALANVRKHAAAQNVWLSLGMQEDALVAQIKDDGSGFDPNGTASHFGLQTMRERTEGVGGTFSIQSQPGYGTTIELRLPALEEAA